jgi:uncharacterized protein (TIGR00290 family)
MRLKEKALFCWSGGKDSALALYKVLQDDNIEVVALLTTLNEHFRRVSMHGVREDLLEAQAASIGLPLIKMYVSEGTNSEYERRMEEVLLEYKSKGITKIIFGDIFLEDLRAYREANLEKVNLVAEFPLWKRNTAELINEFIELNFKTITCCVNDAFLDKESVGVELNKAFVASLPVNVDPCGENGELHTFCYEGPVFKKPIKFSVGEKVYKPLDVIVQDSKTKGFWFSELNVVV